MPTLLDPRPDLVILVDNYLSTDTAKRKTELASLVGVSEDEVDCWREGKSRPDGVALRYLMGVLRQRC